VGAGRGEKVGRGGDFSKKNPRPTPLFTDKNFLLLLKIGFIKLK